MVLRFILTAQPSLTTANIASSSLYLVSRYTRIVFLRHTKCACVLLSWTNRMCVCACAWERCWWFGGWLTGWRDASEHNMGYVLFLTWIAIVMLCMLMQNPTKIRLCFICLVTMGDEMPNGKKLNSEQDWLCVRVCVIWLFFLLSSFA